MRKLMKTFWSFLILALLSGIFFIPVIAQETRNDFSILKSDHQGISFIVNISGQDLSQVQVAEGSKIFTDITLEGWNKISQPGKPVLPSRSATIGVPLGANITISTLPINSYQIKIESPILPGKTQHIEGDPSGMGEDVGISYLFERVEDPNIYNSTQTYPGILAEIANEGFLRQQRIAGIALYPVQFDPQSMTLTVYESFQVDIEFAGSQIPDRQLQDSDSAVYESLYETGLLNYEAAKFWREPLGGTAYAETLDGTEGNLLQEGIPWVLPEPAWRITTREEGFYKLSYSDLLDAGVLAGSPDPRYFQMYYLGEPIPIKVLGEEDGVFDLEDAILFYAESYQNKYTQENVYWLTIEDLVGARINTKSGEPAGASLAEEFLSVRHFENNLNYWSLFPGNDDLERFYWGYINNYNIAYKNWSYVFSFPNLISGSARLTLRMIGYTNTEHKVRVYLNETEISVGEISWNGIVPHTIDIDISELLQPGDNTIKLTSTKDIAEGSDIVLVDWFDVEFAHAFITEENRLPFDYDAPGDWLFSVEGFSNSQISVFEVTDPNSIIEITGTEVVSSGTGFAVQYQDNLIEPRSYFAIEDSAYLVPSFIDLDVVVNLHENSADYLLITHRDFWDQAQVLALFRGSQELRVAQVDIQDIYDGFNYGRTDAKAIQQFLQFAYENWEEPAPSYVLLVGDGHFDPKNFLGYNRTSYLPPFLAVVDPWIGETASDNRYVTFGDVDTMPDMMIGRLSVNNPTEAENFINKIIQYEDYTEPGFWVEEVLAVADNADSGGDFPYYSDEIMDNEIPDPFVVNKVYYDKTHTSEESARSAIQDYYNNGVFMINYIGHAAYTSWASEGLFTTDDVPLLQNEERQPFILAMTCFEGFFHRPHPFTSGYEALGEVVTRTPGRGAIASWSPTGLGIATGHDFLNRGFVKALFTDFVKTIGEATWAGKLALWETGFNLDLLDTYVLFGDPATEFLRRIYAGDDAYSVDEDQILVVNQTEGLLVNDNFPEGFIPIIDLLTDVQNGTLVVNPDGSLTYQPDPDWFGIDTFTYRLLIGETYTDPAEVTITVKSVNDPPVAYNQTLQTDVDVPVDIVLIATDDGTGGTGPFSDDPVERSDLTYQIVSYPLHGTLENVNLPNLTYRPNQTYQGFDSFTFFTNDGQYDSNLARITIKVGDGLFIFLPLVMR